MADSPADKPNNVLPLLRIGLEEHAVIHGDDPNATIPVAKPEPGTQPRTGSARMWQPPSVEELQAALPQYEVQAFIARGGMGAVYRGVQRSLGRTVAIKILPPDADDDDEVNFAERFKREARAMASLSHPGIVAVHDAGEVVAEETGRGGDEETGRRGDGETGRRGDGETGRRGASLLYFVMEYIEGTDVAQLIASEGRVEPQRALAISAHVCDALAFAHESGIVHRDIKPSNIMIDRRGRVKVADFGLAKTTTQESRGLTLTGMAMGTRDFVAPETLVAGTKVDQRADIYAVGVMLYQMLTGEIPRGRFELPSQMLPQLDARLDAIIDRAMQRDRDKRYSSALELRADLDAITATPMAMPSTINVGAPASKPTPATLLSQSSVTDSSRLGNGGQGRWRRVVMIATTAVAVAVAFALLKQPGKPKPASNGGTPAADATVAWNPKVSRTVAEQAVKLGASIGWEQNGERSGGKTLPAGDFRLTSISFPAENPAAAEKLAPDDLLPLLNVPELEVLNLQGAKKALNEEVCRRLGGLHGLRNLSLQQTNIQDAWLPLLAGFSRLENLNLAITAVGDAGITKLSDLRSLQTLDASNTSITGETLAKMRFMKTLRSVSAGGLKKSADDDARALIEAGDMLEILNLNGSVRAEAVAGIARLRQLRQVTLARTSVTPAHIQHLANAPSLTALKLPDCQVEDAAWAALPSLKQLTTINLKHVIRTPVLEAALKKFNPPLKIEEAAGEVVADAMGGAGSPRPPSEGGALGQSAPSKPDPRYPVGQWVRPFQKAADINQKWFDAGAKWEEGWITPGAGLNQAIVLAAPNGQGRNWGARARFRWGGGVAAIMLRRNGVAADNTMLSYQFRVSKQGAEFRHGQGRGSVSGSDILPLGSPAPVTFTDGQEVLIEAFAIGDTLYGRVEGKIFTMKTDGVLKEGGFEVSPQIMPCRDIEFINLDGLTEAEAKKAAGLE